MPHYEGEKEEKNIKGCTKIDPKHQRLSPGLLVLLCKHKVCYGFEILRSKESTTTVFNLLLTLFETPHALLYTSALRACLRCAAGGHFVSAGGSLRSPGVTLVNYKGDNISKYVCPTVLIDITRKITKFVNLKIFDA